jgi:hypothetical protein
MSDDEPPRNLTVPVEPLEDLADTWAEIFDTLRIGTNMLSETEAAIYGACSLRLREVLRDMALERPTTGCLFCRRTTPPPHVVTDDLQYSVCFECIDRFARKRPRGKPS